MRCFWILLLSVGALLLAWFYLGGPAAPAPADMDEFDPLVADFVADGVSAVNRSRRDRSRRLQLGMIYEANGMFDLAAQTYEQLISMRSWRGPDAEVWYRLAMLRERQGDVAGAMQAMVAAIEIDPEYAPGHWRMGYWLIDTGDIDEAEASFRRTIELEHSNLAAWFGLAHVHIQRGELDEAIELLDERLIRSSEAEFAAYLLATAYRRSGRLDEAERLGRRPRNAESPQWPDPRADEVNRYRTGYATLRHRAERLVSTGRFDEAIELLERLRREVGEDPPLLNMLGVAHIVQGRSERGLQLLNEALDLDPRNYPTLINLARAYVRTGGNSEVAQDMALHAARRAAAVQPESAQAHALIGSILERRGDTSGAIESYKAAAERDQRDLRPLVDAAFLELQLHQWTDAVDTCRRIIRHDASIGDAHAGLAIALAELGELEAAAHALHRAESEPFLVPSRLDDAQLRVRTLLETTNSSADQP